MKQKKNLILWVLLFFTVSLSAQTRERKITASFSNIPLSEAMKQIEKQTGCTFFYDATQVDVKQKVSLNSKDEALDKALGKMLSPIRLGFEVTNTQIALFQKKAEKMGALAKLRGKVTDEMGEGAIGANVTVEGTGTGVITDLDGNFELDVPKNATVTISYIGYETQKIKFTNQAFLAVQLKVDSQTLEEVVVVGYGTQKKVNLSGSVAQVDSKALESRPVQNLTTGIQGMMPGVTVTAGGGAPGQDSGTIRVRGVGTLNSSNPYILVDGIETSTMNEIDPNDVESISVLKDAASAAIYGSKASNGVILITTKRGKTGKPRISYNGYVGIQNPTMQLERLNSYDYARLYSQAMIAEGLNPRFSEEEIQKFKDGTDPDYVNTDWRDLAFQTGVQHSHNISLSGGTDDAKYMGSVSYLHQDGILPNAMRRQFSGRTNLDMKVNSRLNARLNLAFINNDYSDPTNSYTGGGSYQILGLINNIAPWIVGRAEDGTYGTVSNGNPLAWLDADQTVDRKNQNFTGSLSLDYQLMDGLKATVTGAYVSDRQHYHEFRKFIRYNANKVSNPARLEERYYDWNRTNFDALLNYDKQFGKHGVKGMAGWHLEKYNYSENFSTRGGFPNNNLDDMNAGAVATQTNSGYTRELAMISWFARVNYDYAGKYLFEANIRADASSRFAEGNRWGYFPSFSAAWRISEESFMEDTHDWLNSLKLRASYGLLGNQSALDDYYPWLSTYNLDGNYMFGDDIKSGYYQKSFRLASISWEKSRTWGIGIDASLFNHVDLSIDYYDRKTTDIIMDVPVPNEFGLDAYKDNVGAMLNRGLEVSLSYHNTWGDWTFNATGNFAYNKNELLDLGGVGEMVDGSYKRRRVGERLNSFFGYRTGGFFESDEAAQAWMDKYQGQDGYPFGKSEFKGGDLIYLDTNGDGKITTDDRELLGSSDPSWTFGLNLNGSYKGFDLSMFFSGAAGVKRLLESPAVGDFTGDSQCPAAIWLEAWTPEHKNAKMPRVAYSTNSPSRQWNNNSDFWVQNASYLRMKNLQFGYTFPKNWMKPFGIENLRVYYSAENLFTIHNMLINVDPESSDTRVSGYPLLRTHSFGVSLTF